MSILLSILNIVYILVLGEFDLLCFILGTPIIISIKCIFFHNYYYHDGTILVDY